MNNRERTDFIDRYLNGQLTDDEMADFKKQIKEDERLRAELENYEISREAIRNYGLRNELKQIRSSMLEEKKHSSGPSEARVVSIRQYGMRIAATVMLLLISVFAIQVATLSGEELYDQRAYPDKATSIRGNEPGVPQEQRIQDLYAAGNFREMIQQYESMTVPSVTASFLAGNAYLQLKQPEQAIEAFRKVAEGNAQAGRHDFEEDVAYYLGLSYLSAGQYDQAVAQFEDIRNSDSGYRQYVSGYFMLKLRVLSLFS